jgi:hypothetical protein
MRNGSQAAHGGPVDVEAATILATGNKAGATGPSTTSSSRFPKTNSSRRPIEMFNKRHKQIERPQRLDPRVDRAHRLLRRRIIPFGLFQRGSPFPSDNRSSPLTHKFLPPQSRHCPHATAPLPLRPPRSELARCVRRQEKRRGRGRPARSAQSERRMRQGQGRTPSTTRRRGWSSAARMRGGGPQRRRASVRREREGYWPARIASSSAACQARDS